MKRLLPDAKYISILRDPVDAFESNYVYMGLQNFFKMDINQFAKEKAAKNMKRRPKSIIDKNQLLWDLGLPTEEMEDRESVQRKIAQLDSQFDLVMITERFEESLILLKDLLCWKPSEIAYLK